MEMHGSPSSFRPGPPDVPAGSTDNGEMSGRSPPHDATLAWGRAR
jgi:hypothetical protein